MSERLSYVQAMDRGAALAARSRAAGAVWMAAMRLCCTGAWRGRALVDRQLASHQLMAALEIMEEMARADAPAATVEGL